MYQTFKIMKKQAMSDKEIQKATDVMEYFIQYVSSPWRIVWVNFVAGVFRGLGTLIGASLVIALLVWILSLFVNTPLIGEYATKVQTAVSSYVEDTNYNDEFDRLGNSLEHIEKELSEKNK